MCVPIISKMKSTSNIFFSDFQLKENILLKHSQGLATLVGGQINTFHITYILKGMGLINKTYIYLSYMELQDFFL